MTSTGSATPSASRSLSTSNRRAGGGSRPTEMAWCTCPGSPYRSLALAVGACANGIPARRRFATAASTTKIARIPNPGSLSSPSLFGRVQVSRHWRQWRAPTARPPARYRRWHGLWYASPKPLEQAKYASLKPSCKAVYTGSIPVGAFGKHPQIVGSRHEPTGERVATESRKSAVNR